MRWAKTPYLKSATLTTRSFLRSITRFDHCIDTERGREEHVSDNACMYAYLLAGIVVQPIQSGTFRSHKSGRSDFNGAVMSRGNSGDF